jgi:uncharacterized BrkB/YihY/UPF0761 family membrane protein
MRKYGKWFSPSAFGIALICFAMPLMGIECSGNKLISVTGFDAAVSGVYPEHLDKKKEEIDKSDNKFEPPALLMTIALVFFVFAGVAGLWRNTMFYVITIGAGAGGLLSVIGYRIYTTISFQNSMKATSADTYERMGTAMAAAMVKLVWYYGFWFIIIFGIMGLFTRVYYEKGKNRTAEKST